MKVVKNHTCKAYSFKCAKRRNKCIQMLLTTNQVNPLKHSRCHSNGVRQSDRRTEWQTKLSKYCWNHNSTRILYFPTEKWPLRTKLITLYSSNVPHENSDNCFDFDSLSFLETVRGSSGTQYLYLHLPRHVSPFSFVSLSPSVFHIHFYVCQYISVPYFHPLF